MDQDSKIPTFRRGHKTSPEENHNVQIYIHQDNRSPIDSQDHKLTIESQDGQELLEKKKWNKWSLLISFAMIPFLVCGAPVHQIIKIHGDNSFASSGQWFK